MTSAHDLARELITGFRDEVTPTEPPPPAAPLGDWLRRIDVPAVELQPLGLASVLRRRTSTRFFAEAAVPASAVTALTSAAQAADRAAWPELHETCPLEVVVLALRVDGVDPGIYHVDGDGLVPVADLDPAAATELTIQSEFAGAAAILSVAGDLAAADAAWGAHGYRLLLGRAGSAAYEMWLEAVALGWAGTVFAGFIPASVREPLHSDGTSRQQLFAFAFGAPAPFLTDPAAPDGGTSTGEGREPHGSTTGPVRDRLAGARDAG